MNLQTEVKKKGEILKRTQEKQHSIRTEHLYSLEVVTSVILYKSTKRRGEWADQRGALADAMLNGNHTNKMWMHS